VGVLFLEVVLLRRGDSDRPKIHQNMKYKITINCRIAILSRCLDHKVILKFPFFSLLRSD
jgi:hypothetical protein